MASAVVAGTITGSIVLIIFLLWALSGIAAFVTSLVCFGRGGSTTDKVIGLILAILLGPFYFIYLGVNKSYCRAN